MSTPFGPSITVGPSGKTDRIDLYLIQRGAPVSRARLQRLIEAGEITVGGRKVRTSYRVRPGDRIDIHVPSPTPLEMAPEEIALDIVYEDDSLLLINKPPGLVVHPGPGNPHGTLVNALLYHCRNSLPAIGGRERPGIVHRLDKETSGLMVVAKTDGAHQGLSRQFKEHAISRRYLAIVHGELPRERGSIDLPIGRDLWERKKISARTKRPREALTRYEVLERLAGATLVAVYPQTGRTHQIRVHFAHLNHPIVGDKVYGGRKETRGIGLEVPRQMLHAETLGFLHPIHRRALEFQAPPPSDMQRVLEYLRQKTLALLPAGLPPRGSSRFRSRGHLKR